MSKAATSKPSKKNGKHKLSPAIAQALLEDAVRGGTTDLAFLAERVDPDMPPPPPLPAAPEAAANPPADAPSGMVVSLPLAGASIPYLGATRAAALAAAGIVTLADLYGASREQIAAARGVGDSNAGKIRAWLDAHPNPQADGSTMPPTTAPGPAVAESPDAELAAQNQDVQDRFAEMTDAVARLQAANGDAPLDKKLLRQLDKAQDVLSELAEGPDTLTGKQLKQALKSAARIARLVSQAAELGKLTPKKQALLADAVQDRRKRLEEVLGD